MSREPIFCKIKKRSTILSFYLFKPLLQISWDLYTGTSSVIPLLKLRIWLHSDGTEVVVFLHPVSNWVSLIRIRFRREISFGK
jgi:hypothetical protein